MPIQISIAGENSRRRMLLSAVDSAGDLWVAIYGGGQINRYSPDGVLREVLTVPARQSTCCAFAGPGLNRLYVTTGDSYTDVAEDWADAVFAMDLKTGAIKWHHQMTAKDNFLVGCGVDLGTRQAQFSRAAVILLLDISLADR